MQSTHFRFVAVWLLTMALTGVTWAQVDEVRLSVAPDAVGLAGHVRAATWTPMRVTLDNLSTRHREVICQWVLQDIDGDEVQMERRVALTGQRSTNVWLYGMPRIDLPMQPEWTVRVLEVQDNKPGIMIANTKVRPAQPVDVSHSVVGVIGSGLLGFGLYEEDFTQYEKIFFLRGLSPEQLPDRWYGLSLLNALVWLPQGGSPGDSGVTDATNQAVREWVRRGGHLVIVLPVAGDLWSNSPLADLLPAAQMQTLSNIRPPSWLGGPVPEDLRIDVRVFRPASGGVSPEAQPTVLLRHDDSATGEPVVVTRRFGLGRVTVMGVDLGDPRLVRAGLPNRNRLWGAVFGWRSPAFPLSYIESEIKETRMIRPMMRDTVPTEDFITHLITRTQSVERDLLLFLLVFVVYWLVAGPGSFFLLKQRAMVHHSWVLFMAVVLGFSVVTWGSAMLLRPRNMAATHFTVLDMDASTGQIRAQSWFSMFVPEHGSVHVQVDPYATAQRGQATIAAPGIDRSLGSTIDFVDTRRYTLDATNPGEIDLPVRSTSKTLLVDYAARRTPGGTLPVDQWVMPSVTSVPVRDQLPTGKLYHQVPGDLRDVVVIYCPGGGREPLVRFISHWPVSGAIDLDEPGWQPLATRPPVTQPGARQQPWGGYLGHLIHTRKPGARLLRFGETVTTQQDEQTSLIEVLSFYDTLPPPEYEQSTSTLVRPIGYARRVGRSLDISHRLGVRGLIVMGHVSDGPSPVPVQVDGQPLQARGWTVVRWFCPLAPESSAPAVP